MKYGYIYTLLYLSKDIVTNIWVNGYNNRNIFSFIYRVTTYILNLPFSIFPENNVRYVKFYTNLQHNPFIGLLMFRHVSALTVGELTDNNKSVVHQL